MLGAENMRITMEPTAEILKLNGRDARRWRGTTDTGIQVDVYVPLIRVLASEDQETFERELKKLPAPSGRGVDMRLLYP